MFWFTWNVDQAVAKNICSISRISTMSSQTSRRPLTGYGTKPYGQLWGHATSMPMSQGRKKHMARPGLVPRTSCIPCEHSDHWATEPHGRPVTMFPCLIRFVLESARNHAGIDETVSLLLAARARTHTGHQMSQGRKKHMARPGLEPRTSRIPCEHSEYWATEPHGRPVTIFPLLN